MTSLVRSLGVFARSTIGAIPVFEVVEKRFLKNISIKKEIPPVFIVGAPRTGSTLLYQYLTAKTNFSYISNIASVFYKSPVFITSMLQERHKPRRKLNNEYGLVDGLYSPSEAAKVFEKWFQKDSYVYRDKSFVKKSVYSISKILDGPFLGKNMNNSMRLENILEIFPDALIIFLRRNPLYNAQSILEARKKINGSVENWWSTKPANYESLLNLTPCEQVVAQIKGIEDYVSKRTSNHANLLEVNYEGFCKKPSSVLKRISEWYSNQGFELLIKGNDQLDIGIQVSKTQKLSNSYWKELKHYCKDYFPER